ncbi:unnamed protein product [Hydatigera taeniaeformis]|uniref:Inner membrane protein n=1 Tax=Hydatigena taeniaeformis TaxID=6205 RepID=A0A0R3WTB3_HYDTA|nr:unnamed protein product [Hydatigera taeniaeformis]
MGYGGGASGVFAGSGPLLLQAGGAGFFGLINPWLAGILVCLLPLISALIWACWRCKPGCCPCCVGGAGGKAAGGKFHDTMDRISAGLWAAPPADKDLLVAKLLVMVSTHDISNNEGWTEDLRVNFASQSHLLPIDAERWMLTSS